MSSDISIIDNTFFTDFASVMNIIQHNRSQAISAVNNASIITAWEVGAFVSNRIKNADWGTKVVQQLAEYIHTQDPTLKGWSEGAYIKWYNFLKNTRLNALQHY